jgi:hypothetical protein
MALICSDWSTQVLCTLSPTLVLDPKVVLSGLELQLVLELISI